MAKSNGKSFWTSLPGILTGIAAVIAAVTGILVANFNPTQPTEPNPQPPEGITTPRSQFDCGGQLEELSLIGHWRWFGSYQAKSLSGLFTFKSDCTFTDIPTSGFSGKDEGTFFVSSSPKPSITLTNKDTGSVIRLLITNLSENSFHAASLDQVTQLDFTRAS
jgi:hypothetical protein